MSHARKLTVLLCLQAVPLTAAPRAPLRPPTGTIIASITIDAHSVFETEAPPENKLAYRAANRLHIRTRERIIAHELLFAVGDRYAPALIAETERNLRALSFIRRAEIAATPNKQGGVDVVVRTYDAWSLEVVASFKRVGGVTGIKAGLTEHNILGEGKLGSAVYSRDGVSESKSFGYADPHFLHTKHLLYAMSAVEAPGGRNYSLSLLRPFFASITPQSAGGFVTYTEGTVSTFDGQTQIGSVFKSVGEAGLNYGVAVATSTEHTRRVTFGLLAHHADFQAIAAQITGPFPNREQLGFFQLGGDFEELDFLKVRRMQKFTHDEDYNLGLALLPSVSWAPFVRTWGSTESQFVPSLIVRKGFTWSDQLLFLSSGYSSKYVNGANSNRIAFVDATYFVRGLPYQTLAFHTTYDLGWRIDPVAPLVLGEANGLRGYGLNAFTGDRLFLFNAEDRIFVWDELLRILDVGAVVFYDSGYVWQPAHSIDMANLRSSVGLGLRAAPSRSGTNNPVRVDLAYALNDNRTRSRWSLSILAGQAFGPSN